MVSAIDSLKRWWALSVFIALVCLGAGAVWAAAQPPTPNLWNVAFVTGAIGATVGVLTAFALVRFRPEPKLDEAPARDPLPRVEVTPTAPAPTRAPRIEGPRREPRRSMAQRRAGTSPRVVKLPPRH